MPRITVATLQVEGVSRFDEALVRQSSGLREGDSYSLVEFQDIVSRAVKQLWNLGLFSDVQIEGIQQTPSDTSIDIFIRVVELPRVATITFKGNDKHNRRKLLEASRLREGGTAGPSTVAAAVERIRNEYEKDGYLQVELVPELAPVEGDSSRVNLVISVTEGQKVGIKAIRVLGNDNLSDRQIRKVMETDTGLWIFSRGDYDRQVLEEDRQRIAQRYAETGFLDARVVSDSLAYDDHRRNITLFITVDEGEPYFLHSLTWEGITLFDDEEVRENILARSGERFDETAVANTAANIQGLYLEEGYVYTNVVPQLSFDGHQVDIVLTVYEGEPANVAHIYITGNTKTKDHVIRREILMKPGERFSGTRFERSLREVMALNFFANVELDPPPQPTSSGDLDVTIKVTEKPTGQAMMGAGYSERDGLIGNLGLSLPNFFGNGQQIDFTWDFGRVRRTIQFGITEPWLFNTPTLVGFNLYNSEYYWTTFYKQKRQGGSLTVGRRLRWPDDYFRTSLSYRLEDISFFDFSERYEPSSTYDLRQYDWPLRNSSLAWSLTRDSRDRPEFPTLGSINSLRIETSGGPFGGDEQYIKWDLSQSFFFPTWKSFTLNLRMRAGLVEGFSGWGQEGFVPFNEKYLPGGTSFDGQIRGYDNRRVGPLDVNNLEVGGQSLLIFTLEYLFPLAPQQSLFGLVFVDAGNSWLNLADTDPFDLRRSVGFGVRMYTPMLGLIGFDFGYGFDHYVDGRRQGRWVPHFQFGTQFF